MGTKGISNAIIGRLPRYYRYLGELLEEKVERISSFELSKRMKVTASQIRQDLNTFGGFGQQGYGYNVEYLYQEIGKILGLDTAHHVIVIGAGNLGQALANYGKFTRRGFIVSGIFDASPEVIGKKTRNDLEVRDVATMEAFIMENQIDIAAITLPKEAAADIAQRLVDCGIKAIWNFAHVDLEVPDDVMVENVHLSESLMQLSYRLRARNEEQ
ncbi:MAG: redox-sensing transcriptional repressor Rex [Eubacteriales bacterium]|nr:redox-sensing transcriptional repressor Rex [Eubacteriales bacterium]